MTPYRINKRGTLVLDRQFRGVGRIKRASGTDDPKLFSLLDAMLDTLYKAGRVDILQGIHAGALTPLEVWARFRLGELDRLPSVETMKPLKAELETWVEQGKTGRWNKASRKYAVAAVLKLAKKSATVQDIPVLLRAYAMKAKGPTMFNRTRAAMQAYLRDTLGRSHPLYGKVRDVMPHPEQAREGNPQTVEGLTDLTAKLHPAHAAIAWAMALTGMGPGELWGTWTQHHDRIDVRGTKRKGRRREIPSIRPISRPTRLYRPFLDALNEASDGAVRPYDLRKTFSNWMEAAGIPRTRRMIYLGHGAKDVTDLYERHEVLRYLAEDGERLKTHLGHAPVAAGIRLAK
jgi:integrase